MWWIKSILGLGKAMAEAFNSAFAALQREQDRAAGANEANLKARVKQDEIEKDAGDVWDGPDRGRFRVRNDNVSSESRD